MVRFDYIRYREDLLMSAIQTHTIPWTDNFEIACQQAGQDQKLVLLDFFSPT
jgi:hypothetical protein